MVSNISAGDTVRLRRRGAPKATVVQVYQRASAKAGAVAGDIKVLLLSTGQVEVVSPELILY